MSIRRTFKTHDMRTYLTNLITEKGTDLEATIQLDGHFGLTYEMLVDFICSATEYHSQIKNTLVQIDFLNGDIFHYLNHLAQGMVQSLNF